MKTKLTRIHLGLGMPEIGVQFETLDDAGQKTSTQRAFVVVDDAAMAPIWAAAQVALDAALAQLPLDMPPGNVTTALMQQRTAEHAAAQAREAERQARSAAAESLETVQKLLAEIEARRAELAGLEVAVAAAK